MCVPEPVGRDGLTDPSSLRRLQDDPPHLHGPQMTFLATADYGMVVNALNLVLSNPSFTYGEGFAAGVGGLRIDIATIAKMAGTSIAMIEKVYGHFGGDQLREAQSQLDVARQKAKEQKPSDTTAA
jgi:hypothetical protein